VCVYGAGGGVVDTWIHAHDEGVNNACVYVCVCTCACDVCVVCVCVCDVCVCMM
jgi:hypothetical protein